MTRCIPSAPSSETGDDLNLPPVCRGSSGRKEGMILIAPSNSSVVLWLINKGFVCVRDCGQQRAVTRKDSPVLRSLGEEGPVCDSEVLPLNA